MNIRELRNDPTARAIGQSIISTIMERTGCKKLWFQNNTQQRLLIVTWISMFGETNPYLVPADVAEAALCFGYFKYTLGKTITFSQAEALMQVPFIRQRVIGHLETEQVDVVVRMDPSGEVVATEQDSETQCSDAECTDAQCEAPADVDIFAKPRMPVLKALQTLTDMGIKPGVDYSTMSPQQMAAVVGFIAFYPDHPLVIDNLPRVDWCREYVGAQYKIAVEAGEYPALEPEVLFNAPRRHDPAPQPVVEAPEPMSATVAEEVDAFFRRQSQDANARRTSAYGDLSQQLREAIEGRR